MKRKLHYWLLLILAGLVSVAADAQDISLFSQFNGRYDFTFIGNTLNTIENNSIAGQPSPPCTILTSSSATLNLSNGDTIANAYLYWAGSGKGDFDVTLNGNNLSAQRTFNIINSAGLPAFSAFADVTALVQATGNGLYTFSNLDLSAVIEPYCPSGGNFGGWAIVIVYQNNALPLNQLNVYDGMQGVPDLINITLNSLNVIDNAGAKIGFVAWEGDKNISVNESLRINGAVLQNALNPANNAFNGTNSFTGSTTMFNMDLDVYDIQNNINIGDTAANIELTSGQDFVMINCIVTKLNSQLPDATVVIETPEVNCNLRKINVHYTVYNTNSSSALQPNVPIAIYAGSMLIQHTITLTQIPVGGSESGFISLLIPDNIPQTFELTFIVDDDGSGHGIVIELNENNNKDTVQVTLYNTLPLPALAPKTSCNIGWWKARFDFSDYEQQLSGDPSNVVTFFASEQDLQNGTNAISDITNYEAPITPATIYVRVDNANCFSTTTFGLLTRNCPPTVYNYVSANNDSRNDSFFIDGLRNVFVRFRLSVYNRWGTLVWTGNNDSPDWNGFANHGLLINNADVPDGTYYYVLDLNDPDYPQPLTGFVYLTRS